MRFDEALAASGMTPQDALRMAAQAMVIAHLKFGKIPRDMEIRQAQIGNMDDMRDLLRRAIAIGESQQAPYDSSQPSSHHGQLKAAPPPKPPDKSQRLRGDGPHRAVPKSA